MAVPTMEESALCSQLIERVKDYFQSAEHKKEFEEWYKTKYHKSGYYMVWCEEYGKFYLVYSEIYHFYEVE